MNSFSDSGFSAQCDIRVRQEDLGRQGAVGAVGMARWLEDARIRVKLPQFERLVGAREFGPFQIVLVGQSVEVLGQIRRTDPNIEVHSGIRRIGRSSFTFRHAVFAGGKRVGSGEATVLLIGSGGPLALPEELIADLTALRLPDSSDTVAARPEAVRHQRDHYPFFTPLRARIGDVDVNQHVNFIALATWYDEAIAAFTSAALGTAGLVPDLAPSSYRIDYIGEVTYPGEYELGVRVRSFDTDSVHYELGIFTRSTCLGVAEATAARGEMSAESLTPR